MTIKKEGDKRNFSPLNQVKSLFWFGAEEDHCGIPFSSSWDSVCHERNSLHDVRHASDISFRIIPELEDEEELPF